MVTLSSNPWPSPAEYEFIRQLAYTHSRIHLGLDKKEMVGQRLQRRLKALGLAGFQEYCEFLKGPEGGNELTSLIDVISTNVTSFFREEQHFQFLSNAALPQWAASPNRRVGDVFRVWSAGCSSGEEPYSAAIVLAEFFARNPRHRGHVMASDISGDMLQRARAGVYRTDQIRLPEVEWLKRYFLKGVGAFQGCCRVKDELKKLVAFHHANLFAPGFPTHEQMDAILCRNVMIYFNRRTQEELVQRLSARLAPGGYLLIGHSDSLLGLPHAFTPIGPSVYRLIPPAARAPAQRLAIA
ncbi:MAG TPA: CheR family methyltransferase [Verrucomicrobiae bacterium]|jgi:chemotaxis protein methyltransferase CheR